MRFVSITAMILAGAMGSALAQIPGGGGIVVGSPIQGTCTSGYVLYSNSGVLGCENLAGGGNVINSGTPTVGQIGIWVDATHIRGLTLLPVASGGTNLASGTSGGVLAYTASGTLASSAALTANMPVIGGGAGAAPSVGTRSGNTTAFVTTTGTQTSGDCVKIDASGNHVANGSACGGGGSLTVTDGTHSVASTTTLTVNSGTLLVGGSAGSATLTPIITDAVHAGGFSSWNAGGQDDMSASGTATFPTLTAGQSLLLATQSGATATLSASGITLAGLASTSTLRQFGFLSCAYNASNSYSCFGFPGFGTITSGALMKFAGADGAATAGDLSGDCTTSGSLAVTCVKGSSSAFGIVKVDGTTITASGGVITAVGAAASSVTPGTTTVVGATAPCLLENSTGTTMACPAVATSAVTALGTAVNTAGGVGTVGTSGATVGLLNGNNTFSGTQTFGAVVGGVNAQTGTTYTLAATDCGQTVKVTNAAAITVTTFQAAVVGCAITVVQGGAGQITFANGGSATLVSAHSYTKTFNAAGATVTLQVLANGGSAAVFTLSGDGA